MLHFYWIGETNMEKNLTEEELFEIKRKYGLEVLKNESIKLIILTGLFLALDQLVPFLFAVAVLLPVRIFSGGLHMGGNISCFAFSLCFFIVSVELFPMFGLNLISATAFIVCSFICICMFSPTDNPKKPILSDRIRKQFKIKAIILTLVVIAVIYFFYLKGYMTLCSTAVGVLTMQAAQLLTANLIPKKGGIKNEE